MSASVLVAFSTLGQMGCLSFWYIGYLWLVVFQWYNVVESCKPTVTNGNCTTGVFFFWWVFDTTYWWLSGQNSNWVSNSCDFLIFLVYLEASKQMNVRNIVSYNNDTNFGPFLACCKNGHKFLKKTPNFYLAEMVDVNS